MPDEKMELILSPPTILLAEYRYQTMALLLEYVSSSLKYNVPFEEHLISGHEFKSSSRPIIQAVHCGADLLWCGGSE